MFDAKVTIFVLILFSWLWSSAFASGPYPPAAGKPGSTAVHLTDPNFVGWATGVSVIRGLKDIANISQGYVSYGDPNDALGPAQGKNESGVVSLGDAGRAILTFAMPIYNGPGWDFAVFENSFDDTFLELAFVEVSSDGENYVRFPAVSLTQTDTQVGSFGLLDATNIHNLAGKYRQGYGTPFDLEEVKDLCPLVNVNRITHVRIIDVVGRITPIIDTGGQVVWSPSLDSKGNIVNDPYTTPFESGGFDLDAVGVRHQKTLWSDFSGDGIVNYEDFAILAAVFLKDDAGWDELLKLINEWLLTEPWYVL